jgi:hypothetical protein
VAWGKAMKPIFGGFVMFVIQMAGVDVVVGSVKD